MPVLMLTRKCSRPKCTGVISRYARWCSDRCKQRDAVHPWPVKKVTVKS